MDREQFLAAPGDNLGEDEGVILGQFMLLDVHAVTLFPELFGFATSRGTSRGTSSLTDIGENSEEDLAQIVVARDLCLRWLIYEVLDNYDDGFKWWVKPRSTAWFYEFLMGYYGDDRWLENMRMTRATFGELCDILGPSIIKQDTNYMRAMPIFARVGAAVYKLTSGDGFGKVSEKFAMGKMSVQRVLHEVCVALGDCLGHLISLPQGQDLIDVMTLFHEQSGIPNVSGVLDVTHIYITAPNTQYYRDYHKFRRYSICLQAVCDASWRFRDIYVGMLGSVNDTRVLKYSSLWDRASRRVILNEDPLTLPWRVRVRPFLLADLGYPVMSWLIIPIRHLDAHGFLTREEQRFNRKHKVIRRHVEQTFGLLKKVFGELGDRTDLSVEALPLIVRACCILQNFMIDKQENDFEAILREWEIEVAARAAIGGADDENEEHTFIAQMAEGRHGNLVDEELEGLESTRTRVRYVSAMRGGPRLP